jgi:uncharacterized protein with ATP-grasp and redox domains
LWANKVITRFIQTILEEDDPFLAKKLSAGGQSAYVLTAAGAKVLMLEYLKLT